MLTDQQIENYIKAIILPQLNQFKTQTAAQNSLISALQKQVADQAAQITTLSNSSNTGTNQADTYLVGTGILHKLATTFNSLVTFISSIKLSGLTVSQPLKLDSSGIAISAPIDLANNTDEVTGILKVANGGTGKNTLTTHGVLLGNAANTVNVTTTGTAGQALLSNGSGADPGFGDIVQKNVFSGSPVAPWNRRIATTNNSPGGFVGFTAASSYVQAELQTVIDWLANFDAVNQFTINADGQITHIG